MGRGVRRVMGWKRIGNNRYFYRSVRKGGKVRSEYVGGGREGELFAKMMEVFHLEDMAERELEAEEREAVADREAELDALVAEAWIEARAVLGRAGYHNRRGQWRRRRRSRGETE